MTTRQQERWRHLQARRRAVTWLKLHLPLHRHEVIANAKVMQQIEAKDLAWAAKQLGVVTGDDIWKLP